MEKVFDSATISKTPSTIKVPFKRTMIRLMMLIDILNGPSHIQTGKCLFCHLFNIFTLLVFWKIPAPMG